MKRLLLLFAIPIIVMVIFIGCPGKQTDEEKIEKLLTASQYTTEAVYDDSSNSPAASFSHFALADTIPWVRFVRWINRPVTREVNATVTDDSATATITCFLAGSFYVDNDPTVGAGLYERTLADSTRRQVKLVRDETAPYGWRIVALTAWQSYTIGANPITSINKVEIKVTGREYTFTLTDPTAFLTKEQLPTLLPDDEVTVTVEVTTSGDSCWAFLHHGRRPIRPWLPHFRDPFYKETTTLFSRTWNVASDSILVTPRVRHAAFDIISWQSLWGDSAATYFSRVWALPYIVKKADDPIPADTTGVE